MTESGNDAGLITKTVEKVEKHETPPVQPEAPPEHDNGRRKPRKRTLAMGAALLVVVVSLGLGYMFFLKPDPEPPARTPRRSISARAKPAKPVQKPAGAKKDAGDSPQEPSQSTGTASQSSSETEAAEGRIAQAGAGMEAATETSPAEPEPLLPTDMGPLPDGPTEPQVYSSSGVEPGQEEEPPALEDESRLATETEYGWDESTPPEEYLEDETLLFPPEGSFSDETTPSAAYEPEHKWGEPTVEVAERSESRAERYYKKGLSYQQEGKLSSAIESYCEALNFDPDHLQAHMNLATAYLQGSRFREAEQELAYLYAVKPKDPTVLFNFGLLLYRTGEYVSAEAKLRRLLEEDPFHLEASLLLASIYEERGGVNKALELCMRAYQINSAHPRVLYRLGRAWDMADDPSEAAKYYQLFLSTRSQKESRLELAVRDRLSHLLAEKEEK